MFPPVWVSHRSLRWVIPAGKRVGDWKGRRDVSLDCSWSAPTPPAAEGTFPIEGCALSSSPPTHPGQSMSQTLCVSLIPRWNFSGIFPAETQGCSPWPRGSAWCCCCSSPAPDHGTAVGCSWQGQGAGKRCRRNAGMQRGVGSCAHAGSRSRTSLLSSLPCPRSHSRAWDNPTAAHSESSHQDRVGEARGKRGAARWSGKLFLFGMLSLTESRKSGTGSGRLSLWNSVGHGSVGLMELLRAREETSSPSRCLFLAQGIEFVPQTTRGSGHPTFPEVSIQESQPTLQPAEEDSILLPSFFLPGGKG